jgi:hypothetical protein
MPQPLSNTAHYLKQGRQKGFAFLSGPVCFEERPELAIWIARIIEACAWLESSLTEVLVTMLGSHAPAAMAMYARLTSNAAQSDARIGVAAAILKPRDLDMFTIVHRIASSAIGQRNKIAHGLWGMDQMHFPDALLLLDTNDQMDFQMTIAAIRLEAKAVPPIPLKGLSFDPSRIFVYKAPDFIEIWRTLMEARVCVQKLTQLVDPKRETNDDIYQQLSNVPAIHEALCRLAEKRLRSSQATQPPQPEKPPAPEGSGE